MLSLLDNIVKSFLFCSISQYSLLIRGIIFTILLGIVIYGAVKIQKNRHVFRKLNLQGNEIFEESNDSYFDKYLNKVLYLFENAVVDAIVFEEMDRFNVNSIFERLREVILLRISGYKRIIKKLYVFSIYCVMTFWYQKIERSFSTISFLLYLFWTDPIPMTNFLIP